MLGRNVNLVGEILENLLGELSLSWHVDEDNPEPVSLSEAGDGNAFFTLSESVATGEYYFDLIASEAGRPVAKARTFVTVSSDSVYVVDIDTDHAAWVDEAVLYEIAPWYFGRYWPGEALRMIAEKIPEIASLGVSAIWLQPITPSY